jgi:hypothetical protein
MDNLTINIAKQFTTTPGARTYDDGPFSGQEFFEKHLDGCFKQIVETDGKLTIVLDGTEGYASSFLNEAFRLLSAKYGADEVWNKIILISNEVPQYINKVREAIYESQG